MNVETLEKVLSCKTLPSLPAVAAKVIELTGSDSVSVGELASTIQNDQGLAARILRTVNSSFYGLSTRCSTIQHAIVLLGLSTVKTLALGFSLVEGLSKQKGEGFDHIAYWRRALATAVAAKRIAKVAGLPTADEAFLGGLLQDVGMIALYQALGREYVGVMALAGPDHHALVRHELEALETQHADIGALLVSRWKLPDELVMPVKYHERPTAAPAEHLAIVQAVALGNVAADFLSSPEPAGPLKKFYARAQQWFALNNAQADDILREVSEEVEAMASLLRIEAGEFSGGQSILDRAGEQLRTMGFPPDPAKDQAAGTAVKAVDELTGLASRARFGQAMVGAFERARVAGEPMAVALFKVIDVESLDQSFRAGAADAVIVSLAQRLAAALPAENLVLARFERDVFAAVFHQQSRAVALAAVDAARKQAQEFDHPTALNRKTAPTVRVGLCVGFVDADASSIRRFDDPDQMTEVLQRALDAACRAGAGTIRAYTPKPLAA